MFKKVLIGMLAVFGVIVIASAGYQFGRSLKQGQTAAAAHTSQATS